MTKILNTRFDRDDFDALEAASTVARAKRRADPDHPLALSPQDVYPTLYSSKAGWLPFNERQSTAVWRGNFRESQFHSSNP